MKITVTIEIEVERQSGKFRSKDDVADALIAEIEGANPGSVDVDETEYEVVSFEVSQ